MPQNQMAATLNKNKYIRGVLLFLEHQRNGNSGWGYESGWIY